MPARCFDREAQLVLGRVQVFLGLGAVSCHVIVIGFAGVIHFMDRLNDVVVNPVQVVPVAHLRRQHGTGRKRNGESKNSGDFLHIPPSGNLSALNLQKGQFAPQPHYINHAATLKRFFDENSLH
jgi:hypothetical protein